MSTEPHTDPDRALGEVFSRMARMRAGLGEGAYARCIAAVLITLGRVALEEAERRAEILDGRRARRTDIVVRPFAERIPPGTWPE
jgi:hypothetical protein